METGLGFGQFTFTLEHLIAVPLFDQFRGFVISGTMYTSIATKLNIAGRSTLKKAGLFEAIRSYKK